MSRPHVQVTVSCRYLAEQSAAEESRHAFAYTITIANRGSEAVRLLSRYWRITDGDERVREVRGDGVVGETPRIEPGESFHYTSGAVLETAVGSMEGSYTMVTASGDSFEAAIPPFSLARPGALH